MRPSVPTLVLPPSTPLWRYGLYQITTIGIKLLQIRKLKDLSDPYPNPFAIP